MITFEHTIDYDAVRALLTDPRCWRRMVGDTGPRSFEVGPRLDLKYVLARKEQEAVAVFVIVDEMEVHFCFRPDSWGHTLPIAKSFVEWWWANGTSGVLIGPVPRRNRLALALAKKAGFREYPMARTDSLIYTVMQKPAA